MLLNCCALLRLFFSFLFFIYIFVYICTIVTGSPSKKLKPRLHDLHDEAGSTSWLVEPASSCKQLISQQNYNFIDFIKISIYKILVRERERLFCAI